MSMALVLFAVTEDADVGLILRDCSRASSRMIPLSNLLRISSEISTVGIATEEIIGRKHTTDFVYVKDTHFF
jgi:hypothetical protein